MTACAASSVSFRNMRLREPLCILEGWSTWCPLENCWRGSAIPAEPGLYRVRRVGAESLDYIGQTGLTVRRRLAMLASVYRTEMPYRDPHTAGPALWALRHALGCEFEASVLPIEGDTRHRKGLEALALARYRHVQLALPIRLRQFDHSASRWQDSRTMPGALSAQCQELGSGLRLAVRSPTVTENGR